MIVIVLSLATLSPSIARAQRAKQPRRPRAVEAMSDDCWKEQGTVQARECLSALLVAERRHLAALEDSIARVLDAPALKQFRRAGTAWTAYRKAECEAVFDAYAPGIEAPVFSLDCFLTITTQRRTFLQATWRAHIAP
jgi:uncharacterized protein YecT (DUF1311 family)